MEEKIKKIEKLVNDTHISGIIDRMKKLDDLINIHGVDGLKKRIGDRMIESYIKDKDINRIHKNGLIETYEKDVNIKDDINKTNDIIDEFKYQLSELEKQKNEDLKIIETKYLVIMTDIETEKKKYIDKYHKLLDKKLLNKTL